MSAAISNKTMSNQVVRFCFGKVVVNNSRFPTLIDSFVDCILVLVGDEMLGGKILIVIGGLVEGLVVAEKGAGDSEGGGKKCGFASLIGKSFLEGVE